MNHLPGRAGAMHMQEAVRHLLSPTPPFNELTITRCNTLGVMGADIALDPAAATCEACRSDYAADVAYRLGYRARP